MALENYSRGQKIFMVSLIVFLAAMFTVTGAVMMYVRQAGKTAPADQGTIDGEAIRLVEFQRKRRALSIILGLDRSANPAVPDAPDHIYARVPTMAVQPQAGWPYPGARPMDTSLLEIWPRYQDQDVWCHLVLAKRAREAGVAPRGNPYIGTVVTALMNKQRQDVDKFDQKDLPKQFHDAYGQSIEDLLPTLREALMVRDYVESLVAGEQARLTQVANIAEGNNEEIKAEYARLKIGYFMDEARKDVRRENFRYRSALAAGGFGVGSPPFGYDRFEEAYDKNKSKSLSSDASFSFDVIEAYPGNVPVDIDDDMLELIYKAVRDEMFKAGDDDKQNIDKRLDAEFDHYSLTHHDETKDWGDAEIKKWKDDHRDELMKYRSLYEAKVDLQDALRKKESLKSAQAAISGFLRFVEEEKAKRQRQLSARIDVIKKEEAVWEAKRSYVEELRGRFQTMETQLFGKARGISNELDESAETGNAENDAKAIARISDEFARNLADFDREQINSLLYNAKITTRPPETELNNKLAERDEFLAEKKHVTSDNKVMTDEEVDAKKQQFELEIKAIREKIRLRDEKVPLVENFAEALRSRLAAYELQIRNADEGDVNLRLYVLRELLDEMPIELGKFIRDQRDKIVPQDEVDEYRNQADLIRADHDARQKNLTRDAADTRNWNLTRGTGDKPSILARLGLHMEEQDTVVTWEQVVADSKFAFLENVDEAKPFLEEPANAAGSTSKIMAVPGKGYIILRLQDKTPKYMQGRIEAHDTVVEIAAMRRARELTVKAMRKLRQDILDQGWDAAIAQAKQTYGEYFEVQQTPFFNDKMDIPGVYSDSDHDVLDLSSSPSAVAPDQPFVSRIKNIDPSEGVTKVISEKHSTDPLRRPQNDQWAYLLARVVGRRQVERRLTEDNLKEHQYGSTPTEILRARSLATSETVRKLITPAQLLEGHEIIQYKAEKKKDNTANEDNSEGNKGG